MTAEGVSSRRCQQHIPGALWQVGDVSFFCGGRVAIVGVGGSSPGSCADGSVGDGVALLGGAAAATSFGAQPWTGCSRSCTKTTRLKACPLSPKYLAKYIYIYIYIYIVIIAVMFIYIFIGCLLTWDR